ncbi:MAG: DUF503 domain-containing protein [Planctomycetes bacterium]|nr:DUF503 domain-containing protein [Planctomycetota bacterium]
MRIAVLRVRFLVHGARSLKHKRQVVRSLKDRLRNAFNVAVSETDDQDEWGSAELGIVTIGTDGRYVNGALERVKGYIEANPAVRITEFEIELI